MGCFHVLHQCTVGLYREFELHFTLVPIVISLWHPPCAFDHRPESGAFTVNYHLSSHWTSVGGRQLRGFSECICQCMQRSQVRQVIYRYAEDGCSYPPRPQHAAAAFLILENGCVLIRSLFVTPDTTLYRERGKQNRVSLCEFAAAWMLQCASAYALLPC